ncbi:MAG: hypothetical protein COC24_016905 [Alphaproteobacteria bacterium]|nr:hypothetical protein [Alphaproteobacteria bacterium]
MSDGPHFSVKLKVKWQNTAKICDNAASSVTECAEAMFDALRVDGVMGNLSKVVKELNKIVGSLFIETNIQEIKQKYAGHDLAQSLIGNVEVELFEGNKSSSIVGDALENTYKGRAANCIRAMEETDLRPSSNMERKIGFVKNLRAAYANISFGEIVRETISSSKIRNRSIKRSSIDDGVKL